MQANLSIINDVEAVRQLLNAGHGDIVPTHSGLLVPNHLLDGFKLSKLKNAGFKCVSISTDHITVK